MLPTRSFFNRMNQAFANAELVRQGSERYCRAANKFYVLLSEFCAIVRFTMFPVLCVREVFGRSRRRTMPTLSNTVLRVIFVRP
jgi:hypothetical protein